MSIPEFKLGKLTSDGRMRVAVEKSNSTSVDVYTHSWCDKTTWYQESIRVENEQLTHVSGNISFDFANSNIIDIYHGKITQEDFLSDDLGNSYRLSITVNGSGMTERDPHYGAGGDYVADYLNGNILFSSVLPPSADVRATYYYAQSSKFTVVPNSGTTLSIDIAEVQFSDDVELTDTVKFDTYGYAGIFAPHLVGPSGLSFTYPVNIKSFVYKTRNDYHNAAFKAYPKYQGRPQASGNWREQLFGVEVYDWDYQRASPLYSKYGMYIVLYLEHDTPFNGTYATATLYCNVQNEN